MSNSKFLHVLFNDDSDFLVRFQEYAYLLNPQETLVQFTSVGASTETRSNDHRIGEEFPKLIREVSNTPVALRTNLHVTTFQKGAKQQGITFKFEDFTGYSIPVEWDINNTPKFLVQKLATAFEVKTVNEAIALKIPEIADNRFAAYQDAISSMRDLVAALSKIQAESISANESFIKSKTSEFAEKIILEQERLQSRSTEIEQELANGRLELSKRESDLNLRENRKVRRDLLEKIEKVVEKQTSFERSKETKVADQVTYLVVGLLIVIGLALCGTALGLAANKSIETVVFYPAFLSGTILCGANAIVLTWFIINRSRRNATTDFSIMQYSRDMYRMSWVAELIFEAQTNRSGEHTEKVEIPPQILESFTAQLFSDPKENSTHPLDELRRFTRRFKKLNIGSNGIQAE